MFQRYWSARVGSTIAMQIQTVAIGWQMYDITHSVVDLGLIGLAQFLPAFLLAIPAGYVADRRARQAILQVTLSLRAFILVVLTIASYHGAINREALFVFAALVGSLRAFEMPAHSALLSQTVPASLLSRAVAWSASATQGAIIVGPAIGGYALVVGSDAAYGLAAIFGIAASLFMRRVHLPPPVQAANATRGWRFMLGGLGFIRSKPAILGAVSLDMVAVLFGGASAMLPVFARDILHTSSAGFGLLRAAEGVGAVLVALTLARRPFAHHVGRIMFAAVTTFGVAIVVFAQSHWFVLSWVALFVMGGADMVSVVIRQSLIQLDTPDAMRGRVSAVNSLFVGTSNQLGEFRAGAMAGFLTGVPSVTLCGVVVVGVALLWMRLFPTLLKRDTLAPDVPQSIDPAQATVKEPQPKEV
ncbi:MFS transporter [soil metagenome]